MSRDHTGRRTGDDRRDLLSALLFVLLVQWFRLTGWKSCADDRQSERRTGWDRRRRVDLAAEEKSAGSPRISKGQEGR